MAIGGDTLATGAWCSHDDCIAVLNDLAVVLEDDDVRLDGHILTATGNAMATLRSRWPTDWPFSAPPGELRGRVAVMAVYRALRGRALSGGPVEIVEQLRLDNNRAEAWLDDLADSQKHLEFVDAAGAIGQAAIASPPTGEFGFKE